MPGARIRRKLGSAELAGPPPQLCQEQPSGTSGLNGDFARLTAAIRDGGRKPEADNIAKVELPSLRDRVEALAGCSYTDDSSGIEYYQGNDRGTVSRVGTDCALVTWDRTGRETRILRGDWSRKLKLLNERSKAVPDVGDRVRALAGHTLVDRASEPAVDYCPSDDRGTVTCVEAGHISVVWDQSARTSRLTRQEWNRSIHLLFESAKPLPVAGGTVIALAARPFLDKGGVEHYRHGDEGSVADVDVMHIEIIWPRTGCVTRFDRCSWQQHLRLVRGEGDVGTEHRSTSCVTTAKRPDIESADAVARAALRVGQWIDDVGDRFLKDTSRFSKSVRPDIESAEAVARAATLLSADCADFVSDGRPLAAFVRPIRSRPMQAECSRTCIHTDRPISPRTGCVAEAGHAWIQDLHAS